ncbi:MAG: TIM44-like domain-containing protein [Hyphomicrobiaceae bacterium]
MRKISVKFSTKVFAIVAALSGSAMLAADFAEARGGRGFSFGSRGSRTFKAPPATKTAPRAAQPVQKSITQPGRATNATSGVANSTSRWGGMRGLLLGGLLGAGLMSLFGLGGGLAAFLGFALQMLLIAGIVMLVVSFFRSRSQAGQPAMAQAAARGAAGPQPAGNAYRSAATGGMGMAAPELQITGDDYNAFERLLKEIQLAYTNSDINALGSRVTPEVLSQFAHEIEDNKRQGLSNDLSEPKLLQGDLAESWREGSDEYATVALRYEIIDALVNTKTNTVVQGSTTEPQEVTEVWTFRRPANGRADQWELSAIQQA